eukprot:TRINITY_DN2575_c0_g1_i1.p1 TRINITY_DN2575_c0_g1~~TRINITY_DN2575_c0_g1_i1.p1  ORF type:complete len:143 (+),score=41.68 TRINITY_DN2575_c0_g1_i1:153-581(+)
MAGVATFLSVLASLLLVASHVKASDLRSDVTWLAPKDLTEEFLETNDKPIFMFIHKEWCGACKNLKSELQKDNPVTSEFVELSKKFVMVSGADDEEPQGPEYAPDGGYIPRILFLDTDGKVHPEIKSSNAQYDYYYGTVQEV